MKGNQHIGLLKLRNKSPMMNPQSVTSWSQPGHKDVQGTPSVQNADIERPKEPLIRLMYFRIKWVLAEDMVIKAVTLWAITVPTVMVTIIAETCLKISAT